MREDLSIYLNNSEILSVQHKMTPQESQETELFQKQLLFSPL